MPFLNFITFSLFFLPSTESRRKATGEDMDLLVKRIKLGSVYHLNIYVIHVYIYSVPTVQAQ